jgi:hypothetical protein
MIPPEIYQHGRLEVEYGGQRERLDVPMKYAAPIVPAEIQALETLGFSSLSSKSIMNYISY